MPIYEYQCTQCAHCFEMIQGASEKDTRIACPKCGGEKTQRVLSSFSCGGSKDGESGKASGCGPTPGRFS